jgi:acetyltransferase-like isoleucine patch superfamily enzyme
LEKSLTWLMTLLILKRGDFGGEDVFSPAGSNILAGENIMLNTHCFVGYFTNFMTVPCCAISHPEHYGKHIND